MKNDRVFRNWWDFNIVSHMKWLLIWQIFDVDSAFILLCLGNLYDSSAKPFLKGLLTLINVQHPSGGSLCGLCHFPCAFRMYRVRPEPVLHPTLFLLTLCFSWLTQPFQGHLTFKHVQTHTYTVSSLREIRCSFRTAPPLPHYIRSSHPFFFFSSSMDAAPKWMCQHAASLPALLCAHTTCCSISSPKAVAAKHRSTSLQWGVAVGCRRALSEAHSGKILCLSVRLLHQSQKPYKPKGENWNEQGTWKTWKGRHVGCNIKVIIKRNSFEFSNWNG